MEACIEFQPYFLLWKEARPRADELWRLKKFRFSSGQETENGRRRVEGGRWMMDDGGWRMEDGGWRMEDGG